MVEHDGCVWHELFSFSNEPWCATAVGSNGVVSQGAGGWGLCDMRTGCEIDTGGKLFNIDIFFLIHPRNF